MTTEPEIREVPDPKSLDEAILTLQSNPPVIVKNRDGQAGNQKTKYADLVQVYATVLPRLNELGVIWTCAPDMDGDRFVLRWELKHVPSGDIRTGRYPLGASDNPQQLGSRQSYATRYAFLRVLGLAAEDEDNDGNEVPARPAQRRARATTETGPTTPRERRPVATPRSDADDPDAVNDAQQRKLAIQFRDLGVTDRDRRLALMSEMLDRPITSIKDLTKREASGSIDAIDKALQTDAPQVQMVEIYRKAQGLSVASGTGNELSRLAAEQSRTLRAVDESARRNQEGGTS